MRAAARTIVAALIAFSPAPAHAQATAGAPVETRHRIEAVAGPLDYAARVGWLDLRDGEAVRGRIYYFSYTAGAAPDPGRPIAFVFNGGPGAASVYLHMGALGPHRIAFGDTAEMPATMGATKPNPHTWLAFTDLVFVDPVGTGYSRALGDEARPASPGEFWGIRQDVRWNGEFIARYLDATGRRGSPLLLVGESYGGLRVALLAEALPRVHALRPAGAMLISPLLEYGLWLGTWRYDPWPYVFALPSFAAAAWHHGKAGGADRSEAARRAFVAAAETFALDEYLPALARGAQLPDEARARLYERVAAFSGLPRDVVAGESGRVGREIFIRQLLAGENRILGRYDASMTGGARQPDPSLGGLTAHFRAAFDLYVRDTLKFLPDAEYSVLNTIVTRSWQVTRENAGWGALPGAVEALRVALARPSAPKVMVAHGELDLITTYLASRYAMNQMPLTPAQRANVTFRVYGGGHMMYLHRAEMERLYRDAAAFFDIAVVREPARQ